MMSLPSKHNFQSEPIPLLYIETVIDTIVYNHDVFLKDKHTGYKSRRPDFLVTLFELR